MVPNVRTRALAGFGIQGTKGEAKEQGKGNHTKEKEKEKGSGMAPLANPLLLETPLEMQPRRVMAKEKARARVQKEISPPKLRNG